MQKIRRKNIEEDRYRPARPSGGCACAGIFGHDRAFGGQEQSRKLTAKVDGQQKQISRLTDKVMEQSDTIDRLQEKATDLGRLERHLGREQVKSIVERSKAIEQAERAIKRPKCAFELSR